MTQLTYLDAIRQRINGIRVVFSARDIPSSALTLGLYNVTFNRLSRIVRYFKCSLRHQWLKFQLSDVRAGNACIRTICGDEC